MIPFEKWIRKGEGRCRFCGAHPATQGHAPDCDRKRAPVARTTPPTPKPRRNAWADREETTTWIDRM